MTKVAIRTAQATDLPGVLSLYRELRPDDPEVARERLERAWHEVIDGERSIVVVADMEGEIAATCMLAMISNIASGARRIGLIEHVITGARFRRRGLARQVLEFALAHAWEADCCKVMLLSGVHRHDAHRVYESIGFRGDLEQGYVIKAPQRPV